MNINKFKKTSFIFYIIYCTAALTACSVFTNEKKPESLNISLLASEKMNPNTHGKASPLSIYIYEIKKSDMFDNSDFYSLTNSTSTQAQMNILYDAIILPGEKRDIEIKPKKPKMIMGIVAAYRDINHSGWKKTVMVQDIQPSPWWKFRKSEEPKKLNITFGKTSISKIEWTEM